MQFSIIIFSLLFLNAQGVCTEAGMYALRERRVHVTQEDLELAVAKVTCRFIQKTNPWKTNLQITVYLVYT